MIQSQPVKITEHHQASFHGSVPGKTFFIGEYLAMSGGPSILLATDPRFNLRATRKDKTQKEPVPNEFQKGSPAALYRLKLDASDEFDFAFQDPHSGAGGLGASSAQFALLYAWESARRCRDLTGTLSSAQIDELLEVYRECAWSGVGLRPSGADVVAQLAGGITCFDGRDLSVAKLNWNFKDLTFTLLRTGTKLATHEHLRATGMPEQLGTMRELVNKARAAFDTGDVNLLAGSVTEYRRELERAGLTAQRTLEILSLIDGVSGVRAAKGCGAMGADVILIIHSNEAADALSAWATDQGLSICGGLATLGRGLTVRESAVEIED